MLGRLCFAQGTGRAGEIDDSDLEAEGADEADEAGGAVDSDGDADMAVADGDDGGADGEGGFDSDAEEEQEGSEGEEGEESKEGGRVVRQLSDKQIAAMERERRQRVRCFCSWCSLSSWSCQRSNSRLAL